MFTQKTEMNAAKAWRLRRAQGTLPVTPVVLLVGSHYLRCVN